MNDPKSFHLTPEGQALIEEASKAQRLRLQELRGKNHTEMCKLPGGHLEQPALPEDDPFFEDDMPTRHEINIGILPWPMKR